MSKKLQKVQVVLASPGDVNVERRKARETIINTVNRWAKFANVEFVPVDWEYDSFPSSGDYAQSVINDQFGDDYGVLIGIFWCRVGTPTPNYASGTVEEIERALARAKKNQDVNVKLYFKTKKTEVNKTSADQIDLLHSLKQDWSKRGVYYWEFVKTSEFIELLIRHLALYVEKFYFLDENVNIETETYLTNQASNQMSVVDYVKLFNESAGEHSQMLRNISMLVDKHTLDMNSETAELNRLLKLPKSQKILRIIDKNLKASDRRQVKYADDLRAAVATLKNIFVERFDTYSAALLAASNSKRREKRMMRTISKELPKLIESYENLLIALNDSIKTSQQFIERWSNTRFEKTELKVYSSYILLRETIEDFVRILNETFALSKKLL